MCLTSPMCLPPLEEAFTLVFVRVDDAYSSVCISRRYNQHTHPHTRTHAHARAERERKLGGIGVASVHALRAGDVMNSSGIIVADAAVISSGWVRWRR